MSARTMVITAQVSCCSFNVSWKIRNATSDGPMRPNQPRTKPPKCHASQRCLTLRYLPPHRVAFPAWSISSRRKQILCRPQAGRKMARLQSLRKISERVIPKGWVCPRNLLFRELGEEKQIPRLARDDKKEHFPRPVWP